MSATLAVSIISVIAAALRVVGQILGLRTRPTAAQRAEKAAHDARAASAKGNAAAVNAQVERERIRRQLIAILALGLLCSGCIPLPVPVVSGSGGSGWSGWRIGLSWGAAPATIEIPEGSGGGGGSSCRDGACSTGGGR